MQNITQKQDANQMSSAKTLKSTKSEKVLVVEDDKNLTVLIGYALFEVMSDVEIDWAISFESAISQIITKGVKNKINPYDLIIVDIFLEGFGNGFDLIKVIHRIYPAVPFLIITSLSRDVVTENLSEMQTKNIIHLKKPFIYADCKAEISNIFKIQKIIQ